MAAHPSASGISLSRRRLADLEHGQHQHGDHRYQYRGHSQQDRRGNDEQWWEHGWSDGHEHEQHRGCQHHEKTSSASADAGEGGLVLEALLLGCLARRRSRA